MILTVNFLLNKSKLASCTIRSESYAVKVLLAHLLQKLQSAGFAAAAIARTSCDLFRHFPNKEKSNYSDDQIGRSYIHLLWKDIPFFPDLLSVTGSCSSSRSSITLELFLQTDEMRIRLKLQLGGLTREKKRGREGEKENTHRDHTHMSENRVIDRSDTYTPARGLSKKTSCQ